MNDLPEELKEFLSDQDRVDPGAQRQLSPETKLEQQRDLKTNEAAVMLNVHPNTLRKMLKAGVVYGAYRLNTRGDWRIPRESIEKFKERGGIW